ncbi:MAG TPA: RidA family protein [Segeticoccus sp.]|nr:RidA family protein [Segeticoccus sp.]
MPDLPAPPRPQGRYQPALRHAGTLVTAGMTPRVDGQLVHVGKVGREVSLEDAVRAADRAARNAVAAAAVAAGSLADIERALRLTVYVNATEDFRRHSEVADGASAALLDVLGEERAAVVRSAVGVASLPGGACVEVELTCAC